MVCISASGTKSRLLSILCQLTWFTECPSNWTLKVLVKGLEKLLDYTEIKQIGIA